MFEAEMFMPRMGEGVFEATVIKWLIKEGASFSEGDSVLEIATDKVNSEITASYNGKLKKILVFEGDVVKINTPIAKVITNEKVLSNNNKINNDSNDSIDTNHNQNIKKINATNNASLSEDKLFSPLVKNIAEKANISSDELSKIPGTGFGGRLTKRDLKKFISQQDKIENKIKISPNDELIEIDRIRKVISDNMVAAHKTVPKVTSFTEVDVTNLVNWRNNIKNSFKEKYKVPLTFTPIFIEATIYALKKLPLINSLFFGNKLIKKKSINIGLAVNIPDNKLVVPVIKNANNLSLTELAYKANELAQKAKNGKLKISDTSDATYTISNIGSFNNTMGTPIVTPPQIGIMGFGVIQKKADVYKNKICIRSKIILSHSFDHRIVDGALGGEFTSIVASQLENFDIKKVF